MPVSWCPSPSDLTVRRCCRCTCHVVSVRQSASCSWPLQLLLPLHYQHDSCFPIYYRNEVIINNYVDKLSKSIGLLFLLLASLLSTRRMLHSWALGECFAVEHWENASLLSTGRMLRCWALGECFAFEHWENASLLSTGRMLRCWALGECFAVEHWENASLLSTGRMLRCWALGECFAVEHWENASLLSTGRMLRCWALGECFAVEH